MKTIKWILIWLCVIVVAYICVKDCIPVQGSEGEFSFGYHKGGIVYKDSEIDFPDRREIMWLYGDGCILAFSIDKASGNSYCWYWVRQVDHQRIM